MMTIEKSKTNAVDTQNENQNWWWWWKEMKGGSVLFDLAVVEKRAGMYRVWKRFLILSLIKQIKEF